MSYEPTESEMFHYTFGDEGIRVRRDNWVSVRYAEELNSDESSVTLQWTDRHEILGEKSTDFQVSW
jgi:hypothetical protein